MNLYLTRKAAPLLLLMWVTLLIPAWAAARTLTLKADRTANFTTGHMSVLHDIGGSWGIQDVIKADQAGAFQPLPGDLREGFQRTPVWLKVTVRPDTDEDNTWWLSLTNPLLEDLRLYSPAIDGSWVEVRQGSQTLPRSSRLPSFRLHLPADIETTLYLRIQSRPAVVTELMFVSDDRYHRQWEILSWAWGVYFGVYLIIPLVYLVYWIGTRERIHGWYVIYVSINLLTSLSDRGWLPVLWPGSSRVDWSMVQWLTIVMAGAVIQQFNIVFLSLDRHFPQATRLYRGLTYATSGLALLFLAVDMPHIAMPLEQTSIVVLVLFASVLALKLMRRGQVQGRLFLIAFSIFLLGGIARFARNALPFDLGWIGLYGYQIGSLTHMMILSAVLFVTSGRLRRDKEDAEKQLAWERHQRQEQRDFLAMISHEFRTPLSVIAASVGNLQSKANLDASDQSRCQKILRANDRLTSLMDNYLSAARLDAEDRTVVMGPVDTKGLCKRVVDELDDSSGPRVSLTLPDQPAVCVCDEGLVLIAMRNLIDNARRHSPADATVHLNLVDRGESIEFHVRDEGPGIPEDERPLVFKRYFRGRHARQRPGTGLGLHIVQRAAHGHGGRIQVETAPGKGAHFILTLPKNPPPEPGARH